MESLESAVALTDDQAITRERLLHSIKKAPGTHFKPYSHSLEEWVKEHLDGRIQKAGEVQ